LFFEGPLGRFLVPGVGIPASCQKKGATITYFYPPRALLGGSSKTAPSIHLMTLALVRRHKGPLGSFWSLESEFRHPARKRVRPSPILTLWGSFWVDRARLRQKQATSSLAWRWYAGDNGPLGCFLVPLGRFLVPGVGIPASCQGKGAVINNSYPPGGLLGG